MSDSLISRSEDLRRLRDDGFEVAIVNSQLVISHVPYVTANRTVEYGSLVSELTLAGDVTTTPSTHVVRFAGQMPCDAEGRPLEKLVLSGDQLQVTEGITTSYMFSSKPVPPLFYTDYHDKMTTYAAALSGHAESLVPTATARTYRPIPAADDGVFVYLDTATSRSGTTAVGECLRTRSVGIIGLGGTGAYILDFLAKTPVAEIHLFDPDQFLQHNAFRAPGAASLEQLREQPLKVTYLADRYRSMHRVIIPRPVAIEENNLSLLDDMSFVFIAIDHGPAKRPIMEYLERRGIPFIDVGMGVSVEEGRVAGLVRTTLSTDRAGSRQAARARISTEDVELGEYNTNIQIAELNALNAATAVIMYKKHLGFYADTGGEHFSTYVIDSNDNINEDGSE